jgi:hypothetical protein
MALGLNLRTDSPLIKRATFSECVILLLFSRMRRPPLPRLKQATQREREAVAEFLGPDADKVPYWVALLRIHFQSPRLKETLMAAAGPVLRERIPRLAIRHMDYLVKWLKDHDPRIASLLSDEDLDDSVRKASHDVLDSTYEDEALDAGLMDDASAATEPNSEKSTMKVRLPSIYTLDCLGHFPQASA